MAFQNRCGGANQRIDRPAAGDTPAHIGLVYSDADISVLFMRHEYQSAKLEAKRPNPYALFEEPTFWQTSSQHLLDPAVALKVLGCKL